MNLRRLNTRITANERKVILRKRNLSIDIADFLDKFLGMDENALQEEWTRTKKLFAHRHRNFESRLLAVADIVEAQLGSSINLQGDRRKLFGAYFSMEYSIEAAALFNPSIVPHFDQSDDEDLKFIMSLRAVGEGHISSIEFTEGTFTQSGNVMLASDPKWHTTPQIKVISEQHYKANFSQDMPLPERVLFPQTPAESNGMEDIRLLQLDHGEGENEYVGTYTAYDGHHITSKLLRTRDFCSFDVHTLNGNAVRGKGIAIFPKKINGKYCAIGRQDGFSMTVMYSDSLTQWDTSEPLHLPDYSHDLTQLGNCGAPIETTEGWLLPTHGVGALRRYTIGVALLDLYDPSKLLSYLPFPLLEPNEEEREGYVPNVLYTCGWLRNGDQILIPYAMSDTTCGFATVAVTELLTLLKSHS